MTNNSRRGFLAGLFAGATLAAFPAVASLGSMTYAEKIAFIDGKLSALVAIDRNIPEQKVVYNTLMEETLSFLVDNFDHPTDATFENGLAATRSVLRERRHPEWKNVPPTLISLVIPVAVAKEILFSHRMTILPSEVPSWSRFVSVYGKMIMKS